MIIEQGKNIIILSYFQVESLKIALKHLKNMNIRLKSQQYRVLKTLSSFYTRFSFISYSSCLWFINTGKVRRTPRTLCITKNTTSIWGPGDTGTPRGWRGSAEFSLCCARNCSLTWGFYLLLTSVLHPVIISTFYSRNNCIAFFASKGRSNFGPEG